MESSGADWERRGHERVPWGCNARLMQLGSEAGERVPGVHRVMGRNISEGGLQVWADRLFAVRSRLLVEMESPEIPEGIQAVGSVVWATPASTEDSWVLGIEFLDVGDTAMARIRALLWLESGRRRDRVEMSETPGTGHQDPERDDRTESSWRSAYS